MRIDFSSILYGFDGKPISQAGPGTPHATLANVACQALMAQDPSEKLKVEQKLHRHELARAVYPGGVVEMKAEDAAEIKNCIGRVFGASIVGPAFEAIERPAA